MDKMKFETPDLTQGNIEKIAALFPRCITEARGEDGKLKKAVNFELLRQMLSDEVLAGDEAYEFTWVGKKAAIVEAHKPIRRTLRPCPEESVNWGKTENLYIEGDNLEVLKLLQESYLGKVKMIYIDPPYNTGNDFIYRDDFKQSENEFKDQLGMFDEEAGVRLFKNTDANGRFHSDWCSMMYSRLILARNLLTEDGIIFVSIDDYEVENLRKICNEVFAEDNMLNHKSFIRHIPNGTNKGYIARAHEYILAYAKNINLLPPFKRISSDGADISVERCTNTPTQKNPKSSIVFPRGLRFDGEDTVFEGIIGEKEPIEIIGKMHFKDGKLAKDVELMSSWRNKEQIQEFFKRGTAFDENGQEIFEIFFTSDGKPKYKKKLTCYSPKSVQTFRTYPYESAFDDLYFENPKPVSLLEFLIGLCCNDNDIVLDFFAGSGTTANAAFEVTVSLGCRIRTILVQDNEDLDKTVKMKTGKALTFTRNMIDSLDKLQRPHILSEIGKERICRSAKIIGEENPDKPFDPGFRVFKLDDTNMTDVYYFPGEYSQDMLVQMESNIKPDRTDLDLLFGCLLEWGLPLSMPYTSEQIDGCTVHTYNDGDLIACFDENIPESVMKEIAKRKPLRAVFRDSSFADSPAKINVFEIFKHYAPDARVKVL